MSKEKDGFDSKKRMGNSAQRGVGVNSPAMMEARKGFSKSRQGTSDGYMARGNPKGVMEKNNRTAMEIDKHNRSWNGKKYTK